MKPERPRLLNAEPSGYSSKARQVLRSFAEVTEQELTQPELLQAIPGYELLIVRLGLAVNRDILQTAKRMRAVATATTGLNHIDVEAARERGIEVLSLRGETDFLETIPASSEHSWGLLLALTRRLPAAFDSVRRGEWNRDAHRGHDLQGKRLGILGLGRIGRRVARYALAFGMHVQAFDPKLQDWPSQVARAECLEELLHAAEILSVHVPLNPSTRGLIGAPELALLPRGALLVNTSRGEVIDHEALLAALRSGWLGGAALDVFPGEPRPRLKGNSVLEYACTHDNLVLTPHLAGATHESMEATEIFIAEKLKRWWAQHDGKLRKADAQ